MSTKKNSCAACFAENLLGPFRPSPHVCIFTGAFDRVIPEVYVCPECGYIQLHVSGATLEKMKKFHEKKYGRRELYNISDSSKHIDWEES